MRQYRISGDASVPIFLTATLGAIIACSSNTPTPQEGASGGTSSTGGSAGSANSTSAGGTAGSGGAGVGGTAGTGGTGAGGASGNSGSGGTGGGIGGGGASGGGGGNLGPCPSAATLAPGDTTMTLMADGTERSFLVHAPPSYDGTTRLPVVFDFHGLTGDSAGQKFISGWDDVGDAEGFITVYPQGIDDAWNAGLCCSDGSDDVAFVRQIITTLLSDACIDPKRVYASGCSNGGGMSYKLACEAADVITGIAPVDFDCLDGAGCGDCSPSRPVPVVQFRGTEDELVDYEGDGAFSGAQANFATWGELNQCTGSPLALSQQAACETFPTCGAGVETVLCTVQGGTHCGSYGSFMIPELAWQVLQNHALP